MAEPITDTEQQNQSVEIPLRTELTDAEKRDLREAATTAARACGSQGAPRSTDNSLKLYRRSLEQLGLLEKRLFALETEEPSDDLQWLNDNLRLVRSDIRNLESTSKELTKLPACRTATEDSVPRTVVFSRALIDASDYQLTEPKFITFVEGLEEVEPLRMAELAGMLPALTLALLELIVNRGLKAIDAFESQGKNAPSFRLGKLIRSLRFLSEIDWKETLEQLSIVHRVLLLDPAGVYGKMDFESRQQYQRAVVDISRHSDLGEVELAKRVVRMAEEAVIDRSASPALRDRLRHVGYYLLDSAGSKGLFQQIGYRAPVGEALQTLFRRFPDEIYILGIEFITLITVVALIMTVVRHEGGWGLVFGALLLIIPATQAAVEVMNYLVTTVLTARSLPKMDFSEGVPSSAATMVAIPTLLINEKQIRDLVHEIEVRYLVNRDPNIVYALLTDLPDTAEAGEEKDSRIDLAISLLDGLNHKYAQDPYGGFYLFHRHRVYNPREGAWMGWERKRGKLLDLNQALRKVFDPFPVKAGNFDRLPNIQYVLTLDSDTQLPRGSAHRMIGTMAHPLNRPIIDPDLNIVTQGYGILQPRVGISVHSATRSRLASIYSGQTGYDIYSRAVSDVYQDLYGEGIFTGKGIYDVDALRQVLERRFPRNALLSHDLIEGAYARAGLVSDIEVIDDYPSHYSAYNRRKHRWLRGDWQIVRWIFSRVPDESRHLVKNPISLVSRWKIIDNLRRSLFEPATFFLLVIGWFFLSPGPGFWTLVTLGLLFLPIYFRLVFSLVRAIASLNWGSFVGGVKEFLTSHVSIFLNIAFLAHQALVAVDAIVRTVIRSTVTHSRLLEWETATEAELGIRKRTPVDLYLDIVPVVSVLLGVCLIWQPEAAPYALPFLLVWCFAKAISTWLNLSPHPEDYKLTDGEHAFLREVTLRTWHYFATFSNEKNNWLIPDNVQDEEPHRVADRTSPTNLGLLFNSRQVAYEFGFITLSEFSRFTRNTLNTVWKMPRFIGHLTNWYDNFTLEPLQPLFVSSVDSGNLVASLWSLKQGCLELLLEPVIRPRVWAGLMDYQRLAGVKNDKVWKAAGFDEQQISSWVPQVLATENNADLDEKTRERIAALREEVERFLPWLLPEYEAVRKLPSSVLSWPKSQPVPLKAGSFYADIDKAFQNALASSSISDAARTSLQQLGRELGQCTQRLYGLRDELQSIASQADQLAHEMSFKDLIDERRNLLSIGYDAGAGELAKSCYDLLASEARMATFIAVAKGEAEEQTWFRLGRQFTQCEGEVTLISWTGTMFEYMMPVIWMKSQPNTLLDRSIRAAVRAQQKYGKRCRAPWGMSEAAFSKRDADGNYQYAAFGAPCLALNVERASSVIVSPYSTCLAMIVDAKAGVANLRFMAARKWLSRFGFYESADFTDYPNRRWGQRKYDLVRSWMAHHQGMSLAALCSVIHDGTFQRWFHAEPLVQASELILQERPLRAKPVTTTQSQRVLRFARKTVKRAIRPQFNRAS